MQYSFHDVLILLNPLDSVAVAKRALAPGDVITQLPAALAPLRNIEVSAAIPVAHKLALRDVPESAPVLKYGQTIGFAAQPIHPGQHVHSHNLYLKDYARDYAFGSDVRTLPAFPSDLPAHFEGFARADGRARHPQLPRRRLQRQLLCQRCPLRPRPLSHSRVQT